MLAAMALSVLGYQFRVVAEVERLTIALYRLRIRADGITVLWIFHNILLYL
jgi:hypothetical protein